MMQNIIEEIINMKPFCNLESPKDPHMVCDCSFPTLLMQKQAGKVTCTNHFTAFSRMSVGAQATMQNYF